MTTAANAPQTHASRTKPLSILFCSGANPNLIDGSVVQMVSLAETLSIAGYAVTVLLRGRITDRDSRLTKDLLAIDGITVVEPDEASITRPNGLLTWVQYADEVQQLATTISADLVIARGLDLNLALIKHPTLRGRLCAYLTDIPERASDLTPRVRTLISRIADFSRVFFAQTEATRSFVEAEIPGAAGKTALMLPMVPDSAFVDIDPQRAASRAHGPLELIYAGKFKREWKTLEMTELVARAAAEGAELRITFAGDKFMDAPGEADWAERMESSLRETDGVDWIGALDRRESLRAMSEADAGLSWRDASVDMSSQLSTKVLEYAAAGAPPLMRRTPAHVEIFGEDYPLFIEGEDVLPTLTAIAKDRSLVDTARRTAQQAVRGFTFPVRAAYLKQVIDRAFAAHRLIAKDRGPTKLLLAGHDFKFMGELLPLFAGDPKLQLIYDKWTTVGPRSQPIDRKVLRSADIIFCEWSASNAVWYSKHKRPGQKLIVRLHRFEMDRDWPKQIAYKNVDAFVVVGEHMAERMRAETGVDPAKLHVIPNMVDTLDFQRPKTPGAEYRIGLAGIVPVRKRPERAFEVMRELKRLDPRFSLHIRGRLPSSYREFSTDSFFRLYYQDLYRQITQPGEFQGSVVQEHFGPDMANWFRRMGWILSPSTDESFHLAITEGMASGALPVIWDWKGAAEIHPPESVFAHDPAKIAAHIHETVRSGAWHEQTAEAQRFADRYDTEAVYRRWIDLFQSL